MGERVHILFTPLFLPTILHLGVFTPRNSWPGDIRRPSCRSRRLRGESKLITIVGMQSAGKRTAPSDPRNCLRQRELCWRRDRGRGKGGDFLLFPLLALP